MRNGILDVLIPAGRGSGSTRTWAAVLALALLLPSADVVAQPKPPIKGATLKPKVGTPVTRSVSDVLKKYNLKNFSIKNLSALRNEDPITQLRAYSSAPNRGALPPATAAHPAKSATVNGVNYTLQSTPFTTGEQYQELGSPTEQTSSDGVRVCTKIRAKQDEILEVINNYGAAGNIAPGMIFSDQSVLNGTFQQVPLTRKAFELTTDLVDFSSENHSNLEPVGSPYNLGQINQSVGNLLNRLRNAPVPARIYSEVFELHAEAQMRLALESNASANLEALVGLPLEVSAGQSFSSNDQFEASFAAAAIVQPYFTISVADPPWELVEGSPSGDAVVVSNAVYGRMAFITATAAMASRELKAKMDRVVNAVDLASADVNGEAELRAILETGSVKVQILGGNNQNAAAASVGSMEQFREYVRGIDPTVQGSLGVPLAYIFRYVADDAPVFIKGISEFDQVECRRTERLKVTNASIKVTNVWDFGGDEELYGNIKVTLDGVTKDLWSQNSSSPVKKGDEQSISIAAEPEFRIDPNLVSSKKLKIALNVKDKIEGGPEWVGANDKAKEDGFVKYSPGSVEISLKDIADANGGTLAKTYTLEEGSAQVKVFMTFRMVE